MKRFFLCLLLTTALLAGSVSADRYPQKTHLPVDYADMPCTGFDETILQNALDTLKTPGLSEENAQSLYDTVLTELNELTTQSALAGILYDANGAAPADAEVVAVLTAQSTRLFDQTYAVLTGLDFSFLPDMAED